ncbi:peroxidase 57-like [Aristolochia californica]|uniref:peroxidase 57-like n=1 Tax=Aristolochia californica TaxID=171875 RepID=UPI0035D7897D
MAALLRTVLFLVLVVNAAGSLQVHFYRNSCPQVEIVVRIIVERNFRRDPSIAAGLLRLHFHDCFIRGCDGSVLLDSTDENVAEKEAPPNLSLRGFELIDEIKTELEKRCRGIVSCADILAMATRDGVALSGGASYALPTGRRDGTVSTISEVHLPSPSFSLTAVLSAFQAINLNLDDLITLLGAHAVGFCHCGFFTDRLYNFMGTGLPDPDMDRSLLSSLQKNCPRSIAPIVNISADPKIFIDQTSSSPFVLDNSFYHGVLNGKAVLQLDQQLAFSQLASSLAEKYARSPKAFRKNFSKAMIKLGNVGILTGQQGEIRLNCRKVNKRQH